MSEKEIFPDSAADIDEAQSAKRLAEALEMKASSSNLDPEAIAIVRLFQVLASPEETSEFHHRKLRTQLVAAVPKPRRQRWWGVAAAAAVMAAALLAAYVGQIAGRPSDRLLEEREKMARAVFSSVAAWEGAGASGELGVARTYELQWRARTRSNFESARYARLTGKTAAAGVAGASTSIRTSGGDS